MQECVIKAIGDDEIIVKWTDGSGHKFGKILRNDQVFKTQNRNTRKIRQMVISYLFFACFLVCFLIFAIGVNQQYESLLEVKF